MASRIARRASRSLPGGPSGVQHGVERARARGPASELPRSLVVRRLRRELRRMDDNRAFLVARLQVNPSLTKHAKRSKAESRNKLRRLMKLVTPNPERVLYCVRRKIRKQVLFALGISGRHKRRSPGRGGSYNRSLESNYAC